MGKSTISMVIFNSYVNLPEGNHIVFMVGESLNRQSLNISLVQSLDLEDFLYHTGYQGFKENYALIHISMDWFKGKFTGKPHT